MMFGFRMDVVAQKQVEKVHKEIRKIFTSFIGARNWCRNLFPPAKAWNYDLGSLVMLCQYRLMSFVAVQYYVPCKSREYLP
jgi:hypothetical protein